MRTDYLFSVNSTSYHNAINYDGTLYYNPPMTFTINNKMFITPFGSMDRKKVKINGNLVYIIGENQDTQYISMYIIDLSDNSVDECYISGNDIADKYSPFYDIFNKDTETQIALLSSCIFN